jgi:hypothetical protein
LVEAFRNFVCRMYDRKKLSAAVVIGSLVVAFLGYKFLLPTTNLADCGYQRLSEEASPDGKYIATVSERNCGGMGSYARIVTLGPRTKKFNGDDQSSWVFVMVDQPTIDVHWSGERQLTIKAQGYSRTLAEKGLRRALWRDVSISNAVPTY